MLMQQPAYCRPDALGAAGDEDDFVLEIVHDEPNPGEGYNLPY